MKLFCSQAMVGGGCRQHGELVGGGLGVVGKNGERRSAGMVRGRRRKAWNTAGKKESTKIIRNRNVVLEVVRKGIGTWSLAGASGGGWGFRITSLVVVEFLKGAV